MIPNLGLFRFFFLNQGLIKTPQKTPQLIMKQHVLFTCDSLSVTECSIHSMCVCHLHVYSLPSLEELKRVRDLLTNLLEQKPIALYAEHVTNKGIPFPSVEHLKLIAAILVDAKLLITTQLLGTVIQTNKLDGVTKLARDTFLFMYNPLKPITITEMSDETLAFLEGISPHFTLH